MERIAAFSDEWVCTEDDSRHLEGVADKMLSTVLGIVKDTLVMSTVVMLAAGLALLLG